MDYPTSPQPRNIPDEGEHSRQFIRIGNVEIDFADAISAILKSTGTVTADIRRNFSITPAGSMSIPTLALMWS